MDKLGCSIFAFDPTVEYPPKRGNRLAFNKLGIAGGISHSHIKVRRDVDIPLKRQNRIRPY